jgi:hypothetical protein
MRCVCLGMPARQVAQPALQPERIRNRADERTARLELAQDVSDRDLGVGQVLEQLTRHHDVEGCVRERQLFFRIGPHRLDAEALDSQLESAAVDVDADDRVAFRVMLRERTRSAAEVEDAQTGTADEPGDQSCTVAVSYTNKTLPTTERV